MLNRVTLTTFDNTIEAHIVKGLLESENIRVFLVGEQFSSAQMFFNAGLTHIYLQVPAQQLTQAKQLLAKYKNGEFEQPLTEEFNLAAAVCPQCGSTETIQESSPDSFVISAVMAFFSGVATKPINRTICKQCKTKISD
jgi:Zn ribbon nucleic-acid-binding protein